MEVFNFRLATALKSPYFVSCTHQNHLGKYPVTYLGNNILECSFLHFWIWNLPVKIQVNQDCHLQSNFYRKNHNNLSLRAFFSWIFRFIFQCGRWAVAVVIYGWIISPSSSRGDWFSTLKHFTHIRRLPDKTQRAFEPVPVNWHWLYLN